MQNRHIEGTKEYEKYNERLAKTGFKPNKLFVNVDIAEIISKFHSSEKYDPNPKNNSPREIVDIGQIIGQYWDVKEQKYVATTFVEILYSKKGVHIYPIYPR